MNLDPPRLPDSPCRQIRWTCEEASATFSIIHTCDPLPNRSEDPNFWWQCGYW